MRAVIQTVESASVTVDGQVIGAVDKGLLVLVGVTHDDTAGTARKLAGKIWQMRILDGDRSAADLAAPILVVSQFTLYADTGRGRRPGYPDAAPSPVAEPLVTEVVDALREHGAHVETGRFGAFMHVASVNIGPRTIIVDL